MTRVAVRAAVVEMVGSPPVVQELELAPLEGDEVRVRIEAAGICHTDLSVANGSLASTFPIVLGHEGAGVVEDVGPAATRFQKGDRVVISVAHHCGHCRYCESGCPPLCVERGNSRSRYFRNGAPVLQGFGSGTFAEATVVREISLARVPKGVPLEVAAVSGCAAVTGLGAVLNVVKVRAGSTVAVFGCGGIGASAIMGARLAGAERIVAIDPSEERRLATLSWGATDAATPDLDELRALEPSGFDYAFEAAGRVDALQLAFQSVGLMGEVAILGLPPVGSEYSLPALEWVTHCKRVTGVNMGSFRPNIDFDRYFRLHARGLLPLDELISAKLPITDAAAAFDLAIQGAGIRILLGPTG